MIRNIWSTFLHLITAAWGSVWWLHRIIPENRLSPSLKDVDVTLILTAFHIQHCLKKLTLWNLCQKVTQRNTKKPQTPPQNHSISCRVIWCHSPKVIFSFHLLFISGSNSSLTAFTPLKITRLLKSFIWLGSWSNSQYEQSKEKVTFNQISPKSCLKC